MRQYTVHQFLRTPAPSRRRESAMTKCTVAGGSMFAAAAAVLHVHTPTALIGSSSLCSEWCLSHQRQSCRPCSLQSDRFFHARSRRYCVAIFVSSPIFDTLPGLCSPMPVGLIVTLCNPTDFPALCRGVLRGTNGCSSVFDAPLELGYHRHVLGGTSLSGTHLQLAFPDGRLWFTGRASETSCSTYHMTSTRSSTLHSALDSCQR
jgi:hypothetical protein